MNINCYLENKGFRKVQKYEFGEEQFSEVFLRGKEYVVLDHELCCVNGDHCFDYSMYCETQNRWMTDASRLFRVYYSGDESTCNDLEYWLSVTPETIEVDDTGGSFDKAHIDNTPLEKEFEDIFVEAYGSASVECLQKEYSISVKNSRNAFVDYVVETDNGSFAIEENGVHYHHPQLIGKERYLKQLEKQNTLSLLGFKTYRFSFDNLRFKDQAIDRIKAYLGSSDQFHRSGTIRGTRSFKLYQHQIDILKNLSEDREKGINTSLIVCPTGSGKSQIAIEDIKGLCRSGRIHNALVMVPTKAVRSDWEKRLSGLTKELPITIDLYNKTFLRKNETPQDFYDYILFDEAQHAQAANCSKTLQYFTPKFLVGLTATAERLDQKRLEDIFGTYKTQLTLKEAIDKDVISNIRCYRLLSNIDLSAVRYNGKDYNSADLEKTLLVDSRNILIVETLKKYFYPRKDFYKQGILFCVNVSHAKKMEKLMREAGFQAAAVYGSNKKNDELFQKYENKEIQFLISCQLISEGWDSPQTEIVVMARPTLSKVLYTQQMGRGVRKYPGKECLYVIDVVDNYSGTMTPMCFNSLIGVSMYKDFMGVRDNDGDYLSILGLSETELSMQEIDIFTFEEKYKGYLSPEQAARELYIGTSTLMSWYRKDQTISSLALPIGSRMVPYFSPEDIEHIREVRNMEKHDDTTLLKDFNDFIDENTLTFSFKLVFMLSMLKLANGEGEVKVDELVSEYKQFYLDRIRRGLPVDRANCVYTEEYLKDDVKTKRSLLSNPFEKYERKRFVYYSKDLSIVSFNPILWGKLTEENKERIKKKETTFLEQYYENLGGL